MFRLVALDPALSLVSVFRYFLITDLNFAFKSRQARFFNNKKLDLRSQFAATLYKALAQFIVCCFLRKPICLKPNNSQIPNIHHKRKRKIRSTIGSDLSTLSLKLELYIIILSLRIFEIWVADGVPPEFTDCCSHIAVN